MRTTIKGFLLTATLFSLAATLASLAVSPAFGGEGFVTKARGSTITIDKGADDGLEVGLEVTIVRPPAEAVIHPLTGENLGSPEIELVVGQVSKVSARAASITLMSPPLLALQSGDVARFTTVEERMILDQEVATETTEKAATERREIRSEASRLARNISGIQGTIRGLERAIRELRRFDDDVVKPQFNTINRQIGEMRSELEELRETVRLINSVPVAGPGEMGEGGMTEEEIQALRDLIQEEIDKLDMQVASVQPPALDDQAPPVDDMIEDPEATEDETPFFMQGWFIILVGALGIAGIAFFAYMKMSDGGDEDDEDDEDEEIIEEVEEDEDEDEIDVDVEEDEIEIVETES